ncbi:MAG: HYR domain-containing protein [Acidimicrobiia bacterium]
MFRSLRARAAMLAVGALLVGLPVVGSATPASADPPNPTLVGYTTLSNIELNGVPGTVLTVAPGADVSISADWSDAGNPCVSCIIYLAVGFQGALAQSGCIENDSFTGQSGYGAVDLGDFPTTPGTYDIVADYEEVYSCGQYWNIGGNPSSGYQVVAQVVVPPPTLPPPTISAGVSPPPVDATSASGAPVTFAVPTASDTNGPVPVVCSTPSASSVIPGDTFPIGQTTVTCTATDPADTPPSAQTTLTVTVNDATLHIAPGVNPPPVQATGPTSGAPVTFAVPNAADLSGTVPVVCDHLSGSFYPVGPTTVTCTAHGGPYDTPSTVATTLTVNVYEPAMVPDPPTIGTAAPGNGSVSVSFTPPAYDGSDPVTSYTATCASSDGTSSGSISGPYNPLTVLGLSNGHSYTCTVTATNVIGTSAPSNASNTAMPAAGVASCTDTQTCKATTSTPTSPTKPPQSVDVTGTPTALTGTIDVTAAATPLSCGPSLAVSTSTTLTDSGFSAGTSLNATVTQFAVATSAAEICYSSTVPFLSQSWPTTPQAGTALLLDCSTVANLPPCQLSSTQTTSAIIVRFLLPGGDPTFSVVVPTGRLVWPSTFPTGKLGTPYASRMQSRGGKAPFHWKIASGKLAPGLTLNPATGAVTGTPKAKGTFNCLVQATDSESPPKIADISVSIKIT